MNTLGHNVWLFAGVLAFTSGPLLAQGPQRTIATYEDWIVSCVMEPAAQKSCEMASQPQTTPNQTNRVSQITIARPTKNGPFKIFFQVPTNVWLDTGIKFIPDDKEPGLTATFRWCIPGRCLADADLMETAIKKLRARTEPGRIEYKEAAQGDVTIAVSFKGFVQALDALERE
jgi:invasion protein IalB